MKDSSNITQRSVSGLQTSSSNNNFEISASSLSPRSDNSSNSINMGFASSNPGDVGSGEFQKLIPLDRDDRLSNPIPNETTNDEENGNRILLSRRIARYISKRFKNYGKNADIDQSWDYFERMILPRRMQDEDRPGKYVKAPPGTQDSELYPAFTTSMEDITDFGTGVAVYFETVWLLSILMFVAGLLYIPTFLYYRSDAYGKTDQTISFLQGSLICDDTEWVPCPDCTMEEWEKSPHRIAFPTDGSNNLAFILDNKCASLRWQEGVNHLVVVLYWIVAIVGLARHQRKMEKKHDEAKLTASDYSIEVANPPLDAYDPDEWRTYFEQFGSVKYVTVALHNEDLVALLVKRRLLLQNLAFKIKGRTDDTAPLQFVPRQVAEEYTAKYEKLMTVEAKCRQYLQRQYAVSAIFVTFEKEASQRKALQELTVGKIHIAANNTRALSSNQELLFRGNRVLDIEEAVEPSAIRWQDLDESLMVKVLQRCLTTAITVAIIYLGFITVRRGFEHGSTFAAFEIVLLNILVPKILRFVNLLECHPREGTYQASLYLKVTAFRWTNTAIITMFIKPFMSTIEGTSGALIPSVYAILKAEIITVPIVHMVDIMGNIKRHILAPRAANQAAMNSYFQGAPGFLAEKYSAVTKVVFLCFFYAAIFPSSFFFGAGALAILYWTEKFNLLRTWAPMPRLGDQVAWISRHIFFPLAVFSLTIISEFYWSAYPFDQVCGSNRVIGDDDGLSGYIGTHTVVTPSADESASFQVVLNETSAVYRYCNQDFKDHFSILFSFFEEERDDWMSKDQRVFTFTFGIVSAVTLCIIFVLFFHRAIVPHVHKTIGAKFTTNEVDSGHKYSDQRRINAYVPEVRHRAFHYPLLVCDVSEVLSQNIGWTDPIRNHSYYSMSEDIKFLLKGKKTNPPESPVLSTIRHY